MRSVMAIIGVVLSLTAQPVAAEAAVAMECRLLSAPVIEVTIPPAPPARLIGGFTVQCAPGLRVRANLTSDGRLHGPLDLPYRLDTPAITFTGTGLPQTIQFVGHITLSGAMGTMVMPSRYIDHPLVNLLY